MWIRLFLPGLNGFFLCLTLMNPELGARTTGSHHNHSETRNPSQKTNNPITVFLAGDVMTGRGIDQVLPHPGDPRIYEPYMNSAKGYVRLAEKANGPIQQPVSYSYVWGDALEELERLGADSRIVNLETTVTKSNQRWQSKGIHYRMHPENISCLTSAKIDFCSLANNHILDWGYPGLLETLDALKRAGIKWAGAGRNLTEAEAPAVMDLERKGRVIVFSYGLEASGIPSRWAASGNRPGVNLLTDLSDRSIVHIKEQIAAVKQTGDIVVASVHWGGNWGYDIPSDHTELAHKLIDDAGVDLIHGHSSHHVKGLEVYRNKLIIYGCGDFLNDYEASLAGRVTEVIWA